MKNLKINIEGLASKPIHLELKKDLEITDDIEYEAKRAAARFGYYAVLAEEAQARVERAESSFEVWTAQESRSLEEENGKPFKTVEELKRKLRMIPKYSQWKSTLVKYRKEYRILKVVAKSFEHKKDLIQTVAANRRSEFNG